MVRSIAELKATDEEELIREHDEIALNTVSGTSYYLDELRSRDNAKLAQSMDRFTRKIFWLTVVMAVATLVQLSLALLSYLSS
jgi:hypothetical protein